MYVSTSSIQLVLCGPRFVLSHLDLDLDLALLGLRNGLLSHVEVLNGPLSVLDQDTLHVSVSHVARSRSESSLGMGEGAGSERSRDRRVTSSLGSDAGASKGACSGADECSDRHCMRESCSTLTSLYLGLAWSPSTYDGMLGGTVPSLPMRQPSGGENAELRSLSRRRLPRIERLPSYQRKKVRRAGVPALLCFVSRACMLGGRK